MKHIISILFFATVVCRSHAQDKQWPDISFYGDVMVHASKVENRLRAADTFHSLIAEYLNTPASHANSFADLPWITTVTPDDSLFRVITWQVEDATTYRYYGFIQFLKTPDPLLVMLTDARPLKSEYTVDDPDAWYGAIYYGIQYFKTADKGDAYMIIGFNAHTKSLNQRVADILTVQNGEITFGMPVFVGQDSAVVRNRIILEYADAASATMRFDREKEMLIYDHVIQINTPEGPAQVPDGSYHGFQYKKGFWHFVDSVFNVKVDQPPGGRPKEAGKRDLFGREMDRRN